MDPLHLSLQWCQFMKTSEGLFPWRTKLGQFSGTTLFRSCLQFLVYKLKARSNKGDFVSTGPLFPPFITFAFASSIGRDHSPSGEPTHCPACLMV